MPLEQRRRGVAVAQQRAAEQRLQSKPAPSPPAPVVTAIAPKPAPAKSTQKASPAVPTVSGPWRVQLGAFSQRASADALFKRVSAIAALSGKQAFLVPAGKVTRLQVGPFPTRAAAASACASLKGQPCFPVAAD